MQFPLRLALEADPLQPDQDLCLQRPLRVQGGGGNGGFQDHWSIRRGNIWACAGGREERASLRDKGKVSFTKVIRPVQKYMESAKIEKEIIKNINSRD